ncbi:chorismate synthase [Caldifermentibacillus hisashii]|uniref:Chorismate synthase n=1 Tax=Caldifermentibacillus hisashii TaxID=996558 RepID=A0ABU9K5H5_9BACI
MFNFFKTDTEIKRDYYKMLYDNLKKILNDFENNMNEADAAYSSYTGSVPNLSNSKIPSNVFEPKREELNHKLKQYFDQEKQKRSDLVSAKNKAYEKYMHYKQLAIKEAEERAEKAKKEMKAFEERMEKLYGKR